jgi:hypothetical protein
MREYSDAKTTQILPPVVGRDYRLSNFWLAKKADYINNHILNAFKYIFNIQLIIKLQRDFLNEYTKAIRKKMLSVKYYRNLRRNFCYGIYFNKFHAICKEKFQKCDHIYLAIHSHSAPIFRLRCISIARK